MARGIDSYQHRLQPFAHQREALERSYRKRSFALFMDPGLGKTKVIIDTTALLFRAGHITGLLIAAPNDVHAQWIDEQLPLHLPTDITTRCVVWSAARVRAQRAARELLSPLPHRLHVLAMNHEAFATKKGRGMARKFLHAHPSLFVLDESHAFKDPRRQRTRAVLALREAAFARRILTGTPTGGVPFDMYSQFAFLDPRILHYDSFLAFKHRYGVWTKEHVRVQGKPGEKPRLRQYEALQEYAHLDELYARIAPYTATYTKEQCAQHLPPKLYATLPTHLSDAQRAIYQQLLDTGLVLLREAERGGRVSVAPLEELADEELLRRLRSPTLRMTLRIKLTLLLRLQQAAAGFVTDDEGHTRMIDGTWRACPRMVATVDYVEQALGATGRKVIVWAHFRPALLALEQALLERLGAGAVARIDGTVTGAERAKIIAAFKGAALPSVLVAHPRTMGVGQNLGMASYALYYTNAYSLINRTQSENRIDRLDRTHPCTIVDVVARDAPCDTEVLASLRDKQEFADTLAKMTTKQFAQRLSTTC